MAVVILHLFSALDKTGEEGTKNARFVDGNLRLLCRDFHFDFLVLALGNVDDLGLFRLDFRQIRHLFDDFAGDSDKPLFEQFGVGFVRHTVIDGFEGNGEFADSLKHLGDEEEGVFESAVGSDAQFEGRLFIFRAAGGGVSVVILISVIILGIEMQEHHEAFALDGEISVTVTTEIERLAVPRQARTHTFVGQ